MIDSIEWLKNQSDSLVSLAIILAVAAVPAILAIDWSPQRSRYGLDWGPQNKFLAAAISLFFVLLLLLLFGYIYTNSSPWTGWID